MEEIVRNNDDAPVALYADDLIAKAEQAEKRIEAINRIKRAALRVTNIHDWVNQNGRPYLQVSGGEKVARLFGISWQLDPAQKTIYDDGHFGFTYKGYFYMGSASIEFEGSRSSKDGFFSKAKGQDVPPSEIDENDVKKAALTNTIGNGVTRLLGIRNLTWDDLKEAGIDPDRITSIDYGQSEMTDETKELRDKIEKMLNDMAGGDPKKFAAGLCKITSFVGKDGKEVKGKTKLSQLSEKAIPVTYGKLEKIYAEWKKNHDTAEDIEEGFEQAEQEGMI